MKHAARGHALIAALVTAPLIACMPVASYHSARVLGDGESSFGLTFSSTNYTTTRGDTATLHGIIPEFNYHLGVAEDLEVGGRVAPGFLYGEVDLKYRFLRTPRTHLAVAPAIGQAAFLVTVTSLRLPLILTHEITDRISFTGALIGTTWKLTSRPDGDDDGAQGIFDVGDDLFHTAGFSLGLEFSGRNAYFRPSVEINTMVLAPGEDAERLKLGALVLHFGWISGRELAKLEEMDRKLDRIEDRLSSDNWKVRQRTR